MTTKPPPAPRAGSRHLTYMEAIVEAIALEMRRDPSVVLIVASIGAENPVLFFEAMSLSHGRRAEVSAGDYVEPIGSARLVRPGRDVTLVAWGSALPLGVQAAAALASEGVEMEVVDLRSLAPWDAVTVVDSVRRTRRLVIGHEKWVTGGCGADIEATGAAHS